MSQLVVNVCSQLYDLYSSSQAEVYSKFFQLSQSMSDKILKVMQEISGRSAPDRPFHANSVLGLPTLQQAIQRIAFEALSDEDRREVADNQDVLKSSLDKLSLLNQVSDETMNVLNVWANRGSASEFRHVARIRMIAFLTDPFANQLNLNGLGLSSLPPVFHLPNFATRLFSLNLADNRLTTLPSAIGCLQMLEVLNLSCNPFVALPPALWELSALKKLSLNNTDLRVLPDAIERLRELRELFMNSTPLGALPSTIGNLRHLEGLTLANTRLTTLPSSIGALTALQYLWVCDNRYLTSLPSEIGRLHALIELNLSNNPALQTLPGELLSLPQGCHVNLTESPLSPSNALRRAVAAADYTGPQIDLPATPGVGAGFEIPSIDDSLEMLFSKAEVAQRAFLNFGGRVEALNKVDEFQIWLGKVFLTKDYNGSLQKTLALKVLNYLDLADRDVGFCEHFLAVIDAAEITCGDRVALSILHLGIAYSLATVDPENMRELAELLVNGSWAIKQLEEVARAKVVELRNGCANEEERKRIDEIEVYFAYPVMCKRELELRIDVEEMLYLTCSRVTTEDIAHAIAFVKDQLASPNAYYNILIDREEWLKALAHKYPDSVAAIRVNKENL